MKGRGRVRGRGMGRVGGERGLFKKKIIAPRSASPFMEC